MKKHFKIISLLSLFVIASGIFFIFAKRPADDKPETIMVKVKKMGEIGKSPIIVYYGGDKNEVTAVSHDELDASTLNVIQKLNADGYRVISESSYPVVGNIGNNIHTYENDVWVLTRK